MKPTTRISLKFACLGLAAGTLGILIVGAVSLWTEYSFLEHSGIGVAAFLAPMVFLLFSAVEEAFQAGKREGGA